MAKPDEKPQTPEPKATTTTQGGGGTSAAQAQSQAQAQAQGSFRTDFGALQPLVDAHQSYLTDLSDVWTRTQEACTRENEQYATSVQEAARNSDPKGVEEAWRRYAQGIKRAWVESQKSLEDAYRSHNEGFQGAVSRLDPKMEPKDLASIGSIAIASAQYASSTIGNWNLFCSSSGVDPRMAPIIASLP